MIDIGHQILVDEHEIAALCRNSGVVRLSIFGSVLRGDFSADSDVDLLIVFDPERPVDMFDVCALQSRLEEFFGRKVDLVEEKSLRNPFRRREIMEKVEVLYAA